MYNYETQKHNIFTESGQRMFLRIRDNAIALIHKAGVARMQEIIANCGGGDSWDMLACVDRLVELGEIVEVEQKTTPPGQYRIFRKPYS